MSNQITKKHYGNRHVFSARDSGPTITLTAGPNEDLSIGTDLTVSGDLQVSGDTTLADVDITGTTTITGSVGISGTVNIEPMLVSEAIIAGTTTSSIGVVSNIEEALTTWTTSTTNIVEDWRTIAWSPTLERAVILSADGDIAYSDDLTTWTTTTPLVAIWDRCIWVEDCELFLSVGSSSSVITSPNGISWTTRTNPHTLCKDVCYSPQLQRAVIVASAGNISYSNEADFNVWADAGATPAGSNNLTCVCWSPELNLFVCGGNSFIMSSPDGISWTSRNTTAVLWEKVIWVPELTLFIMSAITGTSYITSPDGITWTTRSNPDIGSSSMKGLDWSPSLQSICMMSSISSNDRLATSVDGINWTTRTSPSSVIVDMTWIEKFGIFCSVGSNGDTTRNSSAYLATPVVQIGTRASASLSMVGKEITLGQSCRKLTIGQYGKLINIGDNDTILNINDRPYGLCGFTILQSTAQSIPHSTLTNLTFSDNLMQTFGHSPPRRDADIFTIQRSGWYFLSGSMYTNSTGWLPSGTSKSFSVGVSHAGTRYGTQDSAWSTRNDVLLNTTCHCVLYLEEGDTFAFRVIQSQGSAKSVHNTGDLISVFQGFLLADA